VDVDVDVAKIPLCVFLLALSCFIAPAIAYDSGVILSETEASSMRKAYSSMLDGQFQVAVKRELAILRTNKNNVAVRRYLGYSFLRLGMLSNAIEQLKIVRQHQKPTATDMCIYGEACLESGNYQLANQWFACALKEDSTCRWARNGLRLTQLLQTQSNQVPESKEVKGGSASAPIVARTFRVASVGNNQICNAWEAYRGPLRMKP